VLLVAPRDPRRGMPASVGPSVGVGPSPCPVSAYSSV
jgi:hypothetical protein